MPIKKPQSANCTTCRSFRSRLTKHFSHDSHEHESICSPLCSLAHSVQEVEELRQRVCALQHALAATEECYRREMEAAAAASEARESKVSPSRMSLQVLGYMECNVIKPIRDSEQELSHHNFKQGHLVPWLKPQAVEEVEELQQQVCALQHALAAAEERHRREKAAAAAASEVRESKVIPLCMICRF